MIIIAYYCNIALSIALLMFSLIAKKITQPKQFAEYCVRYFFKKV